MWLICWAARCCTSVLTETSSGGSEDRVKGPAKFQLPMIVRATDQGIAVYDRWAGVSFFDTAGGFQRIVRLQPFPSSARDFRIPSPDMSDAEAESARRWHRGYESVPVAEHFPAFASIMTDAVDHLWVEEYELPGEERPGSLWTVFNPEGHVLGFVETPEVFSIYEVGEDYILTRVRDELDVESVQLWPLERGSG